MTATSPRRVELDVRAPVWDRFFTVAPLVLVGTREPDGGFDLVYRGRINDLYAAPGRRRPSATTRDLAAAIDEALEGRAPNPARTDAVGCVIEPLRDR